MSLGQLNKFIEHLRSALEKQDAAGVSDADLLKRYVQRRDEAAFEALVRKHGPMVLGVCRRVLHNLHDAEDAFQATFLVLVRKASSLRSPGTIGNWLYGVAYRTALHARDAALKRQAKEAEMVSRTPPAEDSWADLRLALDRELERLPDKYRAAIVLCDLEGKTRKEAARQLGCPEGTVAGRLARARIILAKRLARYGVAVSGGALAAVLSQNLASASLTSAAVSATVKAANLFAVGQAAVGVISVKVAALTEGVLTAMLFNKLKIASVMLLVMALIGSLGAGVAMMTQKAVATDQVDSRTDEPETPTAQAAGAIQGDPAADLLPAQGTVRLGTARYRHGSRIESMAVSADGKLAVTASGYGSFSPALAGRFSPARVFDLTDGRCLYSVPSERGEYTEAAGLSPDGKNLATKDGKFLYFRDATTGKELRRLKYLSDAGGGRSITDWMTFTPDGKQVAVTLMGDATCLVDVETASVTRTFASGGAASACVFSPDGKVMATGGYGQEQAVYSVRIWEVATGKELRRFPAGSFPGPANGMKRALAFSPEGATLVGGGWGDARLRLWETATGKEPTIFPKIGEDIVSVAFAPDGKTVAAAADNIYLFDPVTGKERLRIDRRARGLAFSQDGSVLTGAVSGAIYRWDAASGRQLTSTAGQDSAVEQILVGADGRKIFTTDQDGDLYIWDTAGDKSPRRIEKGVKLGVVPSPDRRFLAWTVRDKYGNSRIRLDDVAAERVIDPVLRSSAGFSVIAGEASVAAFLPDGKSLLTLEGGPPTFRFWDVESGKELRSFTAIPPKSVGNPGMALVVVPFCTPRRAALSPDGKTLAIGPDFPEGVRTEERAMPVRLWDVATGKAGHELNQPMNAVGVPDEADSGRTERLGRGSHRQMKSMDGRAFSPDGRLLVDWAENPSGRSKIDHVYVWDAATGRAVATLAAGPRPGAANAAFAPDGRTLATASADGIVRLWEAATWKVRAEFRGHRDRVTAVAFGRDGRLFTGGLDTVVLGWDVRPPRDAAKRTLADAWEALANSDARAGFQAQGRFLAEPGQAVEWIAARVTPAVPQDPARVKALIADLDCNDFATRERATADLKEYGPVAAAALRKVVAKPSSLEARRRAERLLQDIENEVIPPRELRALRAVEVLEWMATPEARARLLELSKGVPDARLTREAAAACKRLEGRQ